VLRALGVLRMLSVLHCSGSAMLTVSSLDKFLLDQLVMSDWKEDLT